jgi:hypothetical protein
MEMWRDPEIGLVEVDEGRDHGDGIGDEMYHLDPVETKGARGRSHRLGPRTHA